MAISITKPLIEWDNSGTDPGVAKKAAGWLELEKPPANWLNWLFYTLNEGVEELQDELTAHGTDGEHTKVKALDATNATSATDTNASFHTPGGVAVEKSMQVGAESGLRTASNGLKEANRTGQKWQVLGPENFVDGKQIRFTIQGLPLSRPYLFHLRFMGNTTTDTAGLSCNIDKVFSFKLSSLSALVDLETDTRYAFGIIDGECLIEEGSNAGEVDFIVKHPTAHSGSLTYAFALESIGRSRMLVYDGSVTQEDIV